MNSSIWIAIYLPLLIVMLVFFEQKKLTGEIISKKRKIRKGVVNMTNEILKRNIGKVCIISTGSLGTNVSGKITDVKENWIEVETKKGNELINADFVQSVKIK